VNVPEFPMPPGGSRDWPRSTSTGGLVAGSMLAPLMARRIRGGSVVAGGLALAAAGVALLTQLEEASGLAVAVSGMRLATGVSKRR
jgi:hypothetical protein